MLAIGRDRKANTFDETNYDFLVPIDVHDYLADHKVLKYEQFAGNAGGDNAELSPRYFVSGRKFCCLGLGIG